MKSLENLPSVEVFGSFAPTIYAEAELLANTTHMFSPEPVSVASDSRYCTLVNGVAVRLLQRNGIPASLKQAWSGVEDFVDHAHVSVGRTTLADYQYLQFVPEGQRAGLPNCMVISFVSKSDLTEKLHTFHIQEKFHPYWTAM